MKIRLLIVLAFFSFSTQLSQAQIFSEDFNGGTSLSAWTLVDQDGLTPANAVSQFTAAWILSRDSASTDYCASSTSWYSPSGQADDWLISPPIQLAATSILSWDAQAQDKRFPVGYEVRISTAQSSLANFKLNAPLFQNPTENSNWTRRSINLQALGYSNQRVYLAWRNNSNDQCILNLDNIRLDSIRGSNANLITARNIIKEFWQIPNAYADTLNFASAIENVGADTLFNLTTIFDVFRNGKLVYTDSMPVLASLAPADTAIMLATSGYLPTLPGDYHVSYYASFSNADTDSSNNFYLTDTLTISDSTYARDNGQPIGGIGIGSGVVGELGSSYSISRPDSLTSVSIYIANTGGQMTGQPISLNIRSFNGIPGPIIASSDTITYKATGASWVDFDFRGSGGYILLPAADFFIGVVEPDSNLTLGLSSRTITHNVNYLDFPGNPQNGWTTLDNFNIFRCLMIRPHFGNIGLSVALPALEQTAAKKLKVYPNPSSDGRFVLRGVKADINRLNIILFDLKGSQRDAQIQNMGNGRLQIDLNNAAKGIYFLKIQSEGKYQFKKLIVH